METISDVRREEGNPRAGTALGTPIPINKHFGSPSTLHFAALLLVIIGASLIALGLISFVIPITIIGIAILFGGGFIYARAKNPRVL